MTRPSEAQILEYARAVEHRFDQLTACTKCDRRFAREEIWRRMYEVAGGVVLVVLCSLCNAAVPDGSAAEAQFRAWLERTGALLKMRPQGRA